VNAEAPQRRDGNGRSLAGKVAIVTGASRGIGATTAEVFADRGATVMPPRSDPPGRASWSLSRAHQRCHLRRFWGGVV
jgi:NAD(P)-dependent dehydrogenase (short-subunit alcohol dehydrogenase family)